MSLSAVKDDIRAILILVQENIEDLHPDELAALQRLAAWSIPNEEVVA